MESQHKLPPQRGERRNLGRSQHNGTGFQRPATATAGPLLYLVAFGHLDRKPSVEPCPAVPTPGDASRWSGASPADYNAGVEQEALQIPARWDLCPGLCSTHPAPALWAFGPNSCLLLNMRTNIQDVRTLKTPQILPLLRPQKVIQIVHPLFRSPVLQQGVDQVGIPCHAGQPTAPWLPTVGKGQLLA